MKRSAVSAALVHVFLDHLQAEMTQEEYYALNHATDQEIEMLVRVVCFWLDFRGIPVT